MGVKGKAVPDFERQSMHEWRRRGASIATIAATFCRSRSTVYRVFYGPWPCDFAIAARRCEARKKRSEP